MSRPCDWGSCNEANCPEADQCGQEVADWKATAAQDLSLREKHVEFLVGTGAWRKEVV